MAKSKSYFTLRRGSTKSHTFSVVRGKQITKDRVESPTNPRTLRQQAQRMFMATASAAYAGMKAIVNHSFEGIAYNSPSMAEFCRLNAIAIRENGIAGNGFAMNPYRDRALRPGSYVMAQGSLAQVDNSYAGFSVNEGPSGGGSDAQLILGVNMASPTTHKLLALTGGKVNDMLTACYIYDESSAGDYKFAFVRLIIKTDDNDTITAANLASKLTIETNVVGAVAGINDGIIGVAFDAPNVDDGCCKCVIASALENEAWKRSNAVMTVAPSTIIDPSQNEDAFATYPVGDARVLNGEGI